MRRLQPGRIVQQDDGSLLAPDFGDIYASRAGALQQSRSVFLAGCDLPARLSGRLHTVLETGFGTGLNALALAQAAHCHSAASPSAQQGGDGGLCSDLGRPSRPDCHIHYVGIEARPLSQDDLAAALAPHDELGPWRDALLAGWPPPIEGVYRWQLAARFTLTLAFGEVFSALRSLDLQANSVFLDGFAPDRNPAMWTPDVLAEVVAHCASGARIASWCVAGDVRRALQAVGCQVERRPGFGAKRERLEAVVPSAASAGVPDASSERGRVPNHVLVVGAGIAGAAVAERFAARGLAVTIADPNPPASGASGNPVGVVRPEPSGPDHPISQLTALGTLWLEQWLRGRGGKPSAAITEAVAQRCGALRLPRDHKHSRRLREHVDASPVDWMQWLDTDPAAARIGQPVGEAGVWIDNAWTVRPPALVAAMLDTPGIELRNDAVVGLEPLPEGGWRVIWQSGVGETWPCVVVANAFGLDALPVLPLRMVRGQLSRAALVPGRELHAIVCREGYVTPAFDGQHIVGATFQRDDADLAPRHEDDITNAWRLAQLLPGWAGEALRPARVSVRAATPDRLPLVGQLGPDLYASLGHGSRGLTCAPLCGELLASQVCGEPLPLPRDLVARLAPLRFVNAR